MAAPELRAVTAKDRRRKSAEREFRAAVLTAHAAKHTLRAIGAACDPPLTHVRILQIVREGSALD